MCSLYSWGLSKELLCSWLEAQGAAWRDLCPAFVGLIPKPYSPPPPPPHYSLDILIWGLLCASAGPSFEFMCCVPSQLSSLVHPHTSLSQHLHEGDYFPYESSQEASHLRYHLSWQNLPPDVYLSPKVPIWGTPRNPCVPRAGLCLPPFEPLLPSRVVVLLLDHSWNPATGLPLHSHFLLSSGLHV